MGSSTKRLEPRWPAVLALFAVGGLRLAIPTSLSVGPAWMLITVIGLLLIPTVWSRQRGLDRLNQILGYVVTSVVTLDMIWFYLLVIALPSHKRHLRICCALLELSGSHTFSSSHRGTGVSMRAAHMPANCEASRGPAVLMRSWLWERNVHNRTRACSCLLVENFRTFWSRCVSNRWYG